MAEPRASRPLMPGYGIVGPDEGSGLLPWSWAEEQLTSSHNFWLAVENAKYGTHYGMDMLDPAENCAYQMRPTWVFGLRADEFTGSPTRWIFSNPR